MAPEPTQPDTTLVEIDFAMASQSGAQSTGQTQYDKRRNARRSDPGAGLSR